jgi:hypothetical protein
MGAASLSEGQKNQRVTQSRLLLDLIQRHPMADVTAIATGDKSWFRYVYLARTTEARSQSDVTSCLRSGIGTLKVMITVFTETRLLVLKVVPKGRKFNQDYFLEEVIPSLSRQKRSNRRKKLEPDPYEQLNVP